MFKYKEKLCIILQLFITIDVAQRNIWNSDLKYKNIYTRNYETEPNFYRVFL